MKRLGWRAIIYDVDWARFETGQTGIIVSSDGKTCETMDDTISSIRIEAEKNNTSNYKTGHVLFRQKGSELFDVFCILQRPSDVSCGCDKLTIRIPTP